MKAVLVPLIVLLALSCRTSPEKNEAGSPEPVTSAEDAMTYPNELQKVFEAHGGLDKWQDMKTLVFELPKEPREKHITDLRTMTDKTHGLPTPIRPIKAILSFTTT